ncbi:hypothetical protein BJ508DRAFT_375351, partial [Ascobolus immersus RN42]
MEGTSSNFANGKGGRWRRGLSNDIEYQNSTHSRYSKSKGTFIYGICLWLFPKLNFIVLTLLSVATLAGSRSTRVIAIPSLQWL